MFPPLRALSCVMTLGAILSPLGTVLWTAAHLALDAHHHEETSPPAGASHHDAAAVLHGHPHDHGTPAHSHDAIVTAAPDKLALPILAVHPSVSGVACAALVGDASFVRVEPPVPQRIPTVLRI